VLILRETCRVSPLREIAGCMAPLREVDDVCTISPLRETDGCIPPLRETDGICSVSLLKELTELVAYDP
jgi:hypothetical protein